MYELNISEEVFEKYYQKIISYVPDFLIELPEMAAIYRAQARELARFSVEREDVLNQFNIDTATWGLRLHEIKYGIEYDPSQDDESRKETLKAAKRGRGTATTDRIKLLAESFSGGKVDVERHDEDEYFNIKFVGTTGIPKNIDQFKSMIEKFKPAHLAVNYIYNYNTWKDILDNFNSWDEVMKYFANWDEVMNKKIDKREIAKLLHKLYYLDTTNNKYRRLTFRKE